MPKIGNVNHDTSLTRNFFRSKVGLQCKIQHGGGRRSHCQQVRWMHVTFDTQINVLNIICISTRKFKMLLSRPKCLCKKSWKPLSGIFILACNGWLFPTYKVICCTLLLSTVKLLRLISQLSSTAMSSLLLRKGQLNLLKLHHNMLSLEITTVNIMWHQHLVANLGNGYLCWQKLAKPVDAAW